MARVCADIYPKGFSHNIKDGFYMDNAIKENLDILIKNIKRDWDFTIIITAGGEVRVGKSVLAMQIAAYWKDQLEKVHGLKTPFDVETNFVFDGRKLIERGNYLGQKHPYSVLVFDEAGAELEGRKIAQSLTQDVLDFYRECGQYNLLNILVLPEFFDLPKGIALSRSIFLCDVTYYANEEGIFQRGYVKFFSKRNKKYLFLKGKKELDYSAHPYDFQGRYYNFYPIDEKKYREMKQDALRKRETKRRSKFQMQRDACWFILNQEKGMTQKQIGIRMEQLTGIYVDQTVVSDGLRRFMTEDELKTTQNE